MLAILLPNPIGKGSVGFTVMWQGKVNMGGHTGLTSDSTDLTYVMAQTTWAFFPLRFYSETVVCYWSWSQCKNQALLFFFGRERQGFSYLARSLQWSEINSLIFQHVENPQFLLTLVRNADMLWTTEIYPDVTYPRSLSKSITVSLTESPGLVSSLLLKQLDQWFPTRVP